MVKTNAMRILDKQGVPYTPHTYESGKALSAVEVAKALGRAPGQIFKTLVTAGRSGQHYVFVIPGSGELDLRKAASASGEKSIDLIPSRELFPLTGYVHGGCSPLGMKKRFPSFVDDTARSWGTIIISAGKIGLQIELSLDDLEKVLECQINSLI